MTQQCLIVGGGHAAAQLAISLRQAKWEHGIVVVSAENVLPYHRPPLSKGFIAGDKTLDDILLRDADYYQKRDIEFRLNTTAISIDVEKKTLACDNGDVLEFSKLALATGARVRELDLPGSKLQGLHYLRNATDADAISADMQKAKNAVIVGGGYIGLELAASFRKAGIDVTVLEMADRVLNRVAAESLSKFYQRVHEEEGVRIINNANVRKFVGKDKMSAVVCDDGTEYPADLVIVGIGVLPNTELAAQAGLKVDNGIVVDEYAVTSHPDVVAAGDCTLHPNALLGRHIRLESVPNATDQAKSAAASICGIPKPYASLPWFWSDQFDLKLQIAGLNHNYDDVRIRGNVDSGRSVAVFYLKKGQVIAADCVNRAPEFAATKSALSKGFEMRISDLEDESVLARDLVIKET